MESIGRTLLLNINWKLNHLSECTDRSVMLSMYTHSF